MQHNVMEYMAYFIYRFVIPTSKDNFMQLVCIGVGVPGFLPCQRNFL